MGHRDNRDFNVSQWTEPISLGFDTNGNDPIFYDLYVR